MSKKVDPKDFISQIEEITRERMKKGGVVSFQDFKKVDRKDRKKSILIVEDDETLRAAMRRIFEDENYQVITAADGTQLSEVMSDVYIDLIILDIGLPWVDGYEIAELMKGHPDLKEIPIVFVSGRTGDGDVKKAFKVGADDYIKKPFQIEEIKKAVNTLIKLYY